MSIGFAYVWFYKGSYQCNWSVCINLRCGFSFLSNMCLLLLLLNCLENLHFTICSIWVCGKIENLNLSTCNVWYCDPQRVRDHPFKTSECSRSKHFGSNCHSKPVWISICLLSRRLLFQFWQDQHCRSSNNWGVFFDKDNELWVWSHNPCSLKICGTFKTTHPVDM